jgi:flavin-binding protein dodecin
MPVVKTIDLVGVSSEGWRQAAEEALSEAAKTLRGIEGFEVLETSCNVEGSEIKEYLTHVRIKFRIER